jgi:hypothetical protein
MYGITHLNQYNNALEAVAKPSGFTVKNARASLCVVVMG